MIPDTFVDPVRTPEVDAWYGVVGRALALATRFEMNCQALATHLMLRAKPEVLAEPIEVQAELVRKLGDKSLADHIKLAGQFFLPIPGTDIEDLLRRAREARNEIAHEIAGGIIHAFVDEEGRLSFRSHLEPLIRDLALGDRIVSVGLTVLNRDPLPTGDYLSSYPEEVTHWVLDLQADTSSN